MGPHGWTGGKQNGCLTWRGPTEDACARLVGVNMCTCLIAHFYGIVLQQWLLNGMHQIKVWSPRVTPQRLPFPFLGPQVYSTLFKTFRESPINPNCDLYNNRASDSIQLLYPVQLLLPVQVHHPWNILLNGQQIYGGILEVRPELTSP